MLEQEQNNNAGSIFLIRKEFLFVFAIFWLIHLYTFLSEHPAFERPPRQGVIESKK